MKTPAHLYSRLALATSIMLVTGYLIVSAAWTSMNSVSTGDQLSANLWNTFVGNLNDLNSRITSVNSIWPTVTGGIAYTGGNVGIGTTSPTQALDISGSINTTGNIWSSGQFAFTASSIGSVANGIHAPAGNTLAFRTASVEQMRITNGGNVGIGTTAPSERLTLSGSSGPIIGLNGPTTNYRGLKMSDSAGTEKWFAGANNLGNYVVRQDNSIDLMTFSGGNVGIGTATPGVKLDLYTNSAGTQTSLLRVRNNNSTATSGAGMELWGYYAGGKIIGSTPNSASYYGGQLDFQVNNDSNVFITAMSINKSGNVGIGTTSPGTRLSVRQSSNTTTGGLGVENVGGVRGFYFWVDDLNRGRIDVASDGSNPLSINSGGGSVGINVLSPSYKLHVNGTAAGTSWTNLSDQRFKKNITPINSALAMVDKLRGVNFDWRVGEFKDRDFPTGKQVGFIAQEVEKVLPEVVTTDNEGYKGVEYSNITAVLVEAVKELKKENDELKSLVCLDHPTAPICKK